MPEIEVKSSARSEMIDISGQVDHMVPSSLEEGVCLIFCLHTTCGLTVNENADPDVKRDVLGCLEKLAPQGDPAFRHSEGNSDSHIKALITSPSLVVPVRDGRLQLGTWQGVYLCEFDGPRTRTVSVTFTESYSEKEARSV